MIGYGEPEAALTNHGASAVGEYRARDGRAAHDPRHGLSLPAPQLEAARAARFGFQRATQSRIRPRMLLASASRLQASTNAVEQPGLLGCQDRAEHITRPRRRARAPAYGVEGSNGMGVRAVECESTSEAFEGISR